MKLTEQEALAYIDACIRRWRRIRDRHETEGTSLEECYVDAFQSVRSSLFGELLPEEPDPND